MSLQSYTPGRQPGAKGIGIARNFSTLSPLGQAALNYAERGWYVFPCKPNAKDPATPRGQKDATTDPDQIRHWWEKMPDANIGVFLRPSGLVAVDVDAYKPDCEWSSFISGRDLPDTLTQSSASGGSHYIFSDGGQAFMGKLCNGVDVKHNGYILLEPSTYGGGTYRWFNDDDPAPTPDWLPLSGVTAAGERTINIGLASPEEIEWTIDRLKTAENTLDREDWVRLCLAVKAVCGEAARDAFVQFSYRWPDTEPGDPEREWDTARPNGGVSIGTVIHLLGGNCAPVPVEMGYSEDALALELGERSWNSNARYVALWGKWLFWDGSRWQVDERRQHFSKVRTYLQVRAREYLEWAKIAALESRDPEKFMNAAKREAKQMRSNGKVTAIETLARSNAESAVSHTDFDTRLMLLGTPGGTVDLTTGELREARREDMLTKHVAVAPAPEGSVPLMWLKFLDRTFEGDRELVAFMQRVAGYALTGATNEQKLLFLLGTGANGKSVFLNTLTGLYHEYAKRAAAETFLMSNGDKHSTDVAGLNGARLVVGSELPKGKNWNDAVIKDLTGGDRMTARFMRQDYFEFDPQLTLLIAGNTKPSFGAVDEAMRRRVALVPFDVTIPEAERDPDLPAKLRDEWPAILRWCISGCLDWQKFGLAPPESVLLASADYMESEDTLGQFLDDCTARDVNAFTPNADLFDAYSGWCSLEGIEALGRTNFLKAIEERGFKGKRTGSYRGKRGLRLK